MNRSKGQTPMKRIYFAWCGYKKKIETFVTAELGI